MEATTEQFMDLTFDWSIDSPDVISYQHIPKPPKNNPNGAPKKKKHHFIGSNSVQFPLPGGKSCEWRMVMDPKYMEGGKRFISLMTYMTKLDSSLEYLDAIYELQLLSGSGTVITKKVSSIRRFTRKENCHGWLKFLPIGYLEGHVPHKMDFRAIIKVSREILETASDGSAENQETLILSNEPVEKLPEPLHPNQIEEASLDHNEHRRPTSAKTIVEGESTVAEESVPAHWTSDTNEHAKDDELLAPEEALEEHRSLDTNEAAKDDELFAPEESVEEHTSLDTNEDVKDDELFAPAEESVEEHTSLDTNEAAKDDELFAPEESVEEHTSLGTNEAAKDDELLGPEETVEEHRPSDTNEHAKDDELLAPEEAPEEHRSLDSNEAAKDELFAPEESVEEHGTLDTNEPAKDDELLGPEETVEEHRSLDTNEAAKDELFAPEESVEEHRSLDTNEAVKYDELFSLEEFVEQYRSLDTNEPAKDDELFDPEESVNDHPSDHDICEETVRETPTNLKADLKEELDTQANLSLQYSVETENFPLDAGPSDFIPNDLMSQTFNPSNQPLEETVVDGMFDEVTDVTDEISKVTIGSVQNLVEDEEAVEEDFISHEQKVDDDKDPTVSNGIVFAAVNYDARGSVLNLLEEPVNGDFANLPEEFGDDEIDSGVVTPTEDFIEDECDSKTYLIGAFGQNERDDLAIASLSLLSAQENPNLETVSSKLSVKADNGRIVLSDSEEDKMEEEIDAKTATQSSDKDTMEEKIDAETATQLSEVDKMGNTTDTENAAQLSEEDKMENKTDIENSAQFCEKIDAEKAPQLFEEDTIEDKIDAETEAQFSKKDTMEERNDAETATQLSEKIDPEKAPQLFEEDTMEDEIDAETEAQFSEKDTMEERIDAETAAPLSEVDRMGNKTDIENAAQLSEKLDAERTAQLLEEDTMEEEIDDEKAAQVIRNIIADQWSTKADANTKIICSSGSFDVHSCVLQARSPHFYSHFKTHGDSATFDASDILSTACLAFLTHLELNNGKSDAEDEEDFDFDIENMELEILESLLEYCYTGRAKVLADFNKTALLLLLAKELQVESLTKTCVDELMKMATIGNFHRTFLCVRFIRGKDTKDGVEAGTAERTYSKKDFMKELMEVKEAKPELLRDFEQNADFYTAFFYQ